MTVLDSLFLRFHLIEAADEVIFVCLADEVHIDALFGDWGDFRSVSIAGAVL